MTQTLPLRRKLMFILGCWLASSLPAYAQLNTVFSNIFTEILDVRLQRSGSPGFHGTHFLESAARANSDLVPALNSLIAGNVSSLPLSSTSAGVLFDFSTGQPVRVAESMGPIFAETAKPLGKGKILIEANFTFQDLDRFRGLQTDQMLFSFTHKDVTADATLGDNPNESDVIDVGMDLHTRVTLGSLFATMGVTNDLDVSLALPVIIVRMNGTATANIRSFTFGRLGHANHFFGGDTLNPIFQTKVPYDQTGSGIGDLALRLKYSFARGGDLDFASLLDIRFPTGKKDNFLGSGKATYRLWAILSKRIGNTTPHLNIGYARKPADLQSDTFEFRGGFDTKLYSNLTFAFDVLGQVDVNANEAIHLAPGSVAITDRVTNGQSIRVVNLSNIPDSDNDNMYTASFGFRYAPSDPVMFLGNILLPMNSGGLRAQIASTLGVSISL